MAALRFNDRVKNKGFTTIELVVTIVALLVVSTAAYILGSIKDDKKAQPTPITVFDFGPSPTPFTTPDFYSNPTPLFSANPESTLQATLSPTKTPAPITSGIKGTATLKSCTYGSCKIDPVPQMKIDIKNTSGVLLKTVYTNTAGSFSINLDPGSYVVGPFQDPKSSATVATTTVKVNHGYFSEINIKFESMI